LERENCQLNDAMLLTFRVEIFRPSPVAKLIAIVPCSGVVIYGRAYQFDGGVYSEPRPIAFAVDGAPWPHNQNRFAWATHLESTHHAADLS
jgi:hypothetical protein